LRKLVSILLIIFVGCSEKKSNDKEKQLVALAALSLLSQSSKTTVCSTNFNCATMPSFATIAAAGTTSSCALSGCHSAASQQSGLDITDYSSTKAFTNPGNPCSSRMYTAITTGAMVGNSNTKIKEAVFCWIAGGANP